eukprot:CAMPEP_0180392552 /NCGR_PEP_ID=MMETSP0989-20121125/33227_1 /TAXON_ID=697907 /ORGANISM="non described non described, Strain CCMP2293" /LENGTH=177 /DNA_ID=CAMNT_0022394277 /DNA_START=144 /DNA_END=673 /DNA_ORIENTATION=+
MAEARLTKLFSAVNAAVQSIHGCTAAIFKEEMAGKVGQQRVVDIWEWILKDVMERYGERGKVAGDHVQALLHVAHDVILGSRNRARTEPGAQGPAMSNAQAEAWARVFGSSLLQMVPLALDCALSNNNDKMAAAVARLPGMWHKGDLPFVTEELLRKVAPYAPPGNDARSRSSATPA